MSELKQVGGDHYAKMRVEPFEVAEYLMLSPMEFTVVKYLSRYKSKNGIEDLKKALHTVQRIMESPFLGSPVKTHEVRRNVLMFYGKLNEMSTEVVYCLEYLGDRRYGALVDGIKELIDEEERKSK